MKILFAATHTWDDMPSVATILDGVAGDDVVHLVVGRENRGPEAYVREWARQRADRRPTSIECWSVTKWLGASNPERRARRDEYMVGAGGFDVAVVLNRRRRNASARPLEVARLAAEAGIKVALHDYDETLRTRGA